MRFNNTIITEETIIATRMHFAELAQTCIDKAKSREIKVNNLGSYIEWQQGSIDSVMAGKNDCTFAFMQRAYWLQTGQDVALLP